MGFIGDLGFYQLLAFATVFLDRASQVPAIITDPTVLQPARVRRLEEAVKDWRGFLFLAVSTAIIAIVTWMPLGWTFADHLVTAKKEQWIVGNTFAAKIAILCVFVLVGPLWAIVRALNRYQDTLFEIEREGEHPESLKETKSPSSGG
jgi:hypothetical protein